MRLAHWGKTIICFESVVCSISKLGFRHVNQYETCLDIVLLLNLMVAILDSLTLFPFSRNSIHVQKDHLIYN